MKNGTDLHLPMSIQAIIAPPSPPSGSETAGQPPSVLAEQYLEVCHRGIAEPTTHRKQISANPSPGRHKVSWGFRI